MQLLYHKELLKIRQFCRQRYRQFPKDCCRETSKLANALLGLHCVFGRYLPKDFYHAWNYDQKRNLYVDLTADQFNPNHPAVLILSVNNSILSKSEFLTPLFQRHFPEDFDNLLKDYLKNKS